MFSTEAIPEVGYEITNHRSWLQNHQSPQLVTKSIDFQILLQKFSAKFYNYSDLQWYSLSSK